MPAALISASSGPASLRCIIVFAIREENIIDIGLSTVSNEVERIEILVERENRGRILTK